MPERPSNHSWVGPPEAPDEAVHVWVLCRACGSGFGEYQVVATPGFLIPVGHERNDLPSEPGWVRVGARGAGVRGPLTGATAYRIEAFEGTTYIAWRCRGGYRARCRAGPRIAWRVLVARVRRLAAESPERPVEVRL